MPGQIREFGLRSGERTWAVLRVEADGHASLCHQLSETELKMSPPLVAYEGDRRLTCQLAVREHGPCLELIDESGQLRLQLAEGDELELDVTDPRGDAKLRVFDPGPGNIGNGPIPRGSLALMLRPCRVKSDPKIMMGKPVIRNTRITVEHLLLKLRGGATEEDLLAAYPNLTREDLREAWSYAARELRAKRQALPSLHSPSKP